MTDNSSIPKLHSIKIKNIDNVKQIGIIPDDVDENPLSIILEAIDADLENVTISGWTKDGKFWRRSNHARRSSVVYDLNAHIHSIYHNE